MLPPTPPRPPEDRWYEKPAAGSAAPLSHHSETGLTSVIYRAYSPPRPVAAVATGGQVNGRGTVLTAMRAISLGGGRMSSGHRPSMTAVLVALTALVAAAALGWSAPQARAESSESCPTSGGGAVLDWGFNESGQLGTDYKGNAEFAPVTVSAETPRPNGEGTEGITGVLQIQDGFEFEMALRRSSSAGNCTLWAWGKNQWGSFGDGAISEHGIGKEENTPQVTVNAEGKPLTEVKEVAAAGDHTLALRYDGTIWTWGISDLGERGNGESNFEHVWREQHPETAVPRDVALQIPVGQRVLQVAAGGRRDYALLADGEVLAWGEDKANELGLPSSETAEKCYGENYLNGVACVTTPRLVYYNGAPLKGVKSIGAGAMDAYAVLESGEVVAWGDNARGELGNNNTSGVGPARVEGLPAPTTTAVSEVAGGNGHALARLANGQVYAWGSDEEGQLGLPQAEITQTCGGAPCSQHAVGVPVLEHVKQIAASADTSGALVEEANGTKVPYVWEGPNTGRSAWARCR